MPPVDLPFVDIHAHRSGSDGAWRRLACVEPSAARSDPPPRTSFCCGVHPWDAARPDARERFEEIAALAASGRLAAVGETGFDRFRRDIPFDLQASLFGSHAELAERTGLPLILHSVRADADVLSESVKRNPRTPWIIHGCGAGPSALDRLASRGIAVSLGPRELARAGSRERIARVPEELLFLETDDSGAAIEDVYREAARLLDLPIEILAARIQRNWSRLFGDGRSDPPCPAP